MKHAFSIREIIKKQVDWEAMVVWAQSESTNPPPLPKFVKPVTVKNKPGWINFFKELLV